MPFYGFAAVSGMERPDIRTCSSLSTNLVNLKTVSGESLQAKEGEDLDQFLIRTAVLVQTTLGFS